MAIVDEERTNVPASSSYQPYKVCLEWFTTALDWVCLALLSPGRRGHSCSMFYFEWHSEMLRGDVVGMVHCSLVHNTNVEWVGFGMRLSLSYRALFGDLLWICSPSGYGHPPSPFDFWVSRFFEGF
ncbi:hypothetical protein M758_UG288200 [Ceratodon purpureus]|nr:hypothetical protein M758_UG288200 [Ceratodon purpureus]